MTGRIESTCQGHSAWRGWLSVSLNRHNLGRVVDGVFAAKREAQRLMGSGEVPGPVIPKLGATQQENFGGWDLPSLFRGIIWPLWCSELVTIFLDYYERCGFHALLRIV